MRRCACRSQRTRYVEKLTRIIGSERAVADHAIVTRHLALYLHSVRGDPDERIEPVDSACYTRDELRETIKALDVSELVQQDVATLPFRPRRGVGRKEKDGRENSPCHRHRCFVALEKRYAPRESI